MPQICGMQLNNKQAINGSRNLSSNQQFQEGGYLENLLLISPLAGVSVKTVSAFHFSSELLSRNNRHRPYKDLLKLIQEYLIFPFMKLPEEVIYPIVNNKN